VSDLEASRVLIGSAGWSIPAADRAFFTVQGSLLERYASVFSAVEINSSFYRPHRPTTYARWAAATPMAFRFSAKMPKQISHVLRLEGCEAELDRFLFECSHLGKKLGCLLLQLPPTLAYERGMARFFRILRARYDGDVALEPRHQSWLAPQVIDVLDEALIHFVHADPPRVDLRDVPGRPWFYLRLHGSPRTYYSTYSHEELVRYARALAQTETNCWCVFDNTAAGAALGNALALRELIENK